MSHSALIVDDSSTTRLAIKRCLLMSGLPFDPVHEASNGAEALVLLEKEPIDLVLADVHMPVMGGAELIAAMASAGMLAKTKVVVVSSDRSEDLLEALRDAGAQGFVRKPFRPEDIRSVLCDLFTFASEPEDGSN